MRRAPPYPWQYTVADTAGELNETGDGFRYPVVVLSVPRRAGKTTLGLAVNLDRLDVIPDARGWYTCANGREVAAKVFRDEWAPMLTPLARLYRLRQSQGSEGVHKRRGSSRVQLFAPTPSALHSANVDTATVDEAWAATIDEGDGLEGAITPAQLTRPWRQTWIVSAGGTLESTWLDRWITAGELGLPGVAFFDWGADASAPDYDPANPDIWARSHPTAGLAFPMSVLAGEWARRTDDAQFERAYLNVWPRPSNAIAAAGLDLAVWRAASAPTVAPSPVLAIALDVAADRSAASLAIAGPHPDNPARYAVDVIAARPGIAWVAAAAAEARAKYRAELVADSLVAASILAELGRRRVTVDAIGASDHARACGLFVDGLTAGTITHRSQAALDDAVLGAARRPLGDAWLWSRRRSNVDISPLVACTLAAWRAASSRPAGRASLIVSSPTPGQRPPRHTTNPVIGPPGRK